MHTTDDNAEMLKEARDYANKFTALLPERIQAVSLTRKSKLPFKALSIRELLLHRTAALTSAAVDLFDENKVIPAVILTRSIVETFAMLFTFHERLESFLKGDSKDIDALDKFLMSCLVGARDNPEMPKAINVLNSIDRVEKATPNFRAIYDALCECAHPNWAGTFGSFGKVISKIELELGSKEKTPMYTIGLSALSGTIIGFDYYYVKSGELVQQLNEFFEQRENGDLH